MVILLIGCGYSTISRTKLTVQIYVNDDGSAHVIENYEYFIDGNESLQLYQNSLKSFTNKNDITFWLTVLGQEAPTYHIDPETGITNIIITPSEIYSYRPYTQTARASITVEYDVLSEPTEDGYKGVFLVKKIKPRTKEYVLNIKAIRFEKNEYGDVFLPDNTIIEIILPDNAVLTGVQPFPSSLEDRTFPIYNVKRLVWENEFHLPRFAVVFYKEQRLDEEIMEFFTDLQNKATSTLTGPEGWAVIIIVGTLIISYLALHRINKKP